MNSQVDINEKEWNIVSNKNKKDNNYWKLFFIKIKKELDEEFNIKNKEKEQKNENENENENVNIFSVLQEE